MTMKFCKILTAECVSFNALFNLTLLWQLHIICVCCWKQQKQCSRFIIKYIFIIKWKQVRQQNYNWKTCIFVYRYKFIRIYLKFNQVGVCLIVCLICVGMSQSDFNLEIICNISICFWIKLKPDLSQVYVLGENFSDVNVARLFFKSSQMKPFFTKCKNVARYFSSSTSVQATFKRDTYV